MSFELWLEFEEYAEWDPAEADTGFCNVEVRLADGRSYGLNVWTFSYVATARAECRDEGVNLDGAYMEGPDLLVARLERSLLEEVVSDLIAQPVGLRKDWLSDESTT